MNYRFFSVIFAVLMSCNVSLFCFLTPKQEGYFLELVKEMDSQKRSTIFSERIKDELHNHTYNFHTLLLIIDRAEEQLEIGAFSTSLYNTLQTVYKNLFYELWDKLSEPLPALTREAIEKKLTYLFDFSCQAIDYIFLKNKKHTSSAYYIVRHDIIRYFLTILGLSEAAHQSPGMLLYSSTEKKEYLQHAHQKLMKTLSYICETLEPSMIEFTNSYFIDESEHEAHKNALQQIQADFPQVLRNCEKDIEGRFIKFDKEDFIHNTLPTLTTSLAKVSAALSVPAALILAAINLERLYQIPFKEKIVPAIAEGGILFKTVNRFTSGWTFADAKNFYIEKERQLLQEAKKIIEPGQVLMKELVGEEIVTENSQPIHKPGIVQEMRQTIQEGKDKLLGNEEEDGTIPALTRTVQRAEATLGKLTVNKEGQPRTINKTIGNFGFRSERGILDHSHVTNEDVQEMDDEQDQQYIRIFQRLSRHDNVEEENEEYVTPPSSPQQASKRCIIQ